jgi:hypothetical protein
MNRKTLCVLLVGGALGWLNTSVTNAAITKKTVMVEQARYLTKIIKKDKSNNAEVKLPTITTITGYRQLNPKTAIELRTILIFKLPEDLVVADYKKIVLNIYYYAVKGVTEATLSMDAIPEAVDGKVTAEMFAVQPLLQNIKTLNIKQKGKITINVTDVVKTLKKEGKKNICFRFAIQGIEQLKDGKINFIAFTALNKKKANEIPTLTFE